LNVPLAFTVWFVGHVTLETVVVFVALLALIVIVLKLPGVVQREIAGGLNVGDLERDLEKIQRLTTDASDRVENLDLWLKAVDKTNNRRSQVQTLFGTVVGIVGGYSVGWIENGDNLFSADQLVRLALAVAVSLAVAMLMPMFVLPWVDRILAKFGRGDLSQRQT